MRFRLSPATALVVALLLLGGEAGRAAPAFDWGELERLRKAGQSQDALNLLRSADARQFASGDALKAAAIEQQLLQNLARYPEAQAAGRRWIGLAEAAGERRQLVEAEQRTARSFLSQQNVGAAAEHLRRALEHSRKTADDDLQLSVLTDLAQAENGLGRFDVSARLLDQADALWGKKRDPVAGARIKIQRAALLTRGGEALDALPLLEQAVAAATQAGDAALVTTAVIRLGQAQMTVHNYAEALALYRRALSEKLAPQQRVVTLTSVGICEFELNRFEDARRTFEEARKLAVELGSANLEAWALGEIGLTIWKSERDAASAIDYYDRAVRGFEKTGDLRNAPVFLENKALVYREQGRFAEALRLYREVERRMLRIPGQQTSANVYKSMGQCLIGLGQEAEGEKLLRLSIDKALAVGDMKRVWQAHHELARLHRKRKQLEQADASYRNTLDAIESMRRTLRLGAFKADFFEDKVRAYQEYIDFLVSETDSSDRVERAFEVAERVRARSFLDSLAESRAALDETLPADVLSAERTLLTAISTVQGRIRKGENTQELARELQSKEKELEELHLRIRSENPRFQQIRYPKPVDYSSLRKVLRPGELVLEYLIGEQHSHAWLASAARLQHFRLPGREELERAVRPAYARLVRPGDELARMDAVARLLLGPIADGVAMQSLVIIPSGILYYFPFEALPLGPEQRPLVDRLRVSYMPSASTLVEARNRPKARTSAALLALGDTVYRAGGGSGAQRSGSLMEVRNLEALPHTRQEVYSLRSLFGRRNSTILVGAQATEQNLKHQDLRRYSVIHLAAHGFVDSSTSSRSGLVLGMDQRSAEDGILQVREVYRLPLRANLVTLSACQSALGRLVTGEGMVGLARAFFYAGAETIVASLWNVNDDAAAEFMSRFYGRLKAGASKEEALRQAKLAMASEARYRHPYFWAAYILIGDGADPVAFPRDWPVTLGVVALLTLAAAVVVVRRTRRARIAADRAQRTN